MEVGEDITEVSMAYDNDSGEVYREGSRDSGTKGFSSGEAKMDLER